MYDIVIIGAGPSGAAFASLLDKRYKVLILDKRNILCNDINSQLKSFTDDDLFSGKCCGGLLAPNTQKILASVGWPFPKELLVTPQAFALKVLDLKSDMSKLYQRSYLNINRRKFDKWILDKAVNKCTVIQNATYLESRKVASGYEIKYRVNGRVIKETTRILVGADGAFSKIRKEFFKNVKEPKKYAAIQEWYKSDICEPYYYSIGDSDVTDYYSWIIPKENYLILGSALDDVKNANVRFELLKKKLSRHGFTFKKEKLVKKEGSIIYRPRSMNEIALVKDDVILIGEAAGIISPSSSEGISYALRSGIILAEELNKDIVLGPGRYKKRAKALAFKAVCKNIRNIALYNGFFRRIIMKSGICTLKER